MESAFARVSSRWRFTMAVVGFAVASAFAVTATAWAVTDTYCNNCNLGSAPAVSGNSGVGLKWTANHSSTFQAKPQEVYYYPGGHNVAVHPNVFGIDDFVASNNTNVTARCHVIDGAAAGLAKCYAFRP